MHPVLTTGIALLALALAALFANYVVKALLVRALNHVLTLTAYGRDPELRRHGLVERLANVMPASLVIVVRNVPRSHTFRLCQALSPDVDRNPTMALFLINTLGRRQSLLLIEASKSDRR